MATNWINFIYHFGNIIQNIDLRKEVMRMKPRKLREDRFGGIEGMPLMILIMVIVAAAVLGILLVIIFVIDPFGGTNEDIRIYVEDEYTTVAVTDSEMYIYVYDEDDNGVSGATVFADGCGLVNEEGKEVEGEDGKYKIDLTDLDLKGKTRSSFTIEVKKGDLKETTTITVIT